jgi:hypothetical protein
MKRLRLVLGGGGCRRRFWLSKSERGRNRLHITSLGEQTMSWQKMKELSWVHRQPQSTNKCHQSLLINLSPARSQTQQCNLVINILWELSGEIAICQKLERWNQLNIDTFFDLVLSQDVSTKWHTSFALPSFPKYVRCLLNYLCTYWIVINNGW